MKIILGFLFGFELTDFEIKLEIFDFAKVLGRSNFEF